MLSEYSRGVLVGAAAVSVIAFLASAGFLLMDDAADRSRIDSPVRSMIADIQQTIAAGDCPLAEAKLRLLNERWKEFNAGGDSPESFQSEIKRLVLPPKTE